MLEIAFLASLCILESMQKASPLSLIFCFPDSFFDYIYD
jgi:hypothetical protein